MDSSRCICSNDTVSAAAEQIDGVYGNVHTINLSVIAFVMLSSVLFPHCSFTANTLLHLALSRLHSAHCAVHVCTKFVLWTRVVNNVLYIVPVCKRITVYPCVFNAAVYGCEEHSAKPSDH